MSVDVTEPFLVRCITLSFLVDKFQVKLSEMFWLAPNTCMCSMFSVTHDMQEHFKYEFFIQFDVDISS